MILDWANITFGQPYFLWLLLLLPVLWIYWLRKRKQRFTWLRVPSIPSDRLPVSLRTRIYPLIYVLRSLMVILLVLALARPQTILKEEEVKAEGIDIVLVMDLSSSMLSKDFDPNRLEVSKSVAQEFVSKRPYDRLGLVVFAGEAFTQCPLTSDHRILQNLLAQLECGLLKDATAIGMGLATAVNRLKDSPSESKVVVLLTDGVNNAGYIQPMTAAEIAREFGIKVYTIGIGSMGRAASPVSRINDEYIFDLIPVRIDTELLQEIARLTGGKYYRSTNSESLLQIYEEIDALEKTEVEVTTIERYSEEFHALVMWAIVLLIAEALLQFTIFRAIP